MTVSNIPTTEALKICVDIGDDKRKTALHIAVEEGYYNMAKRPLGVGVSFQTKNKRGATALDMSAERGLQGLVDAMIHLLDRSSAKSKAIGLVMHIFEEGATKV